jgi:hypothetical protein
LPFLAATCLLGHEPDIDQVVGEAFSDGKNPGTSRQMITGTAPNLFRHCSVNSRQKPRTAGKHRQQTATARGRVSAGQGPFWLVVAGVGFEPT